MKETLRTFIAVKIQPETKLLDLISRLKQKFQDEGIKWVETDNLHLTLRFIGETTREQVIKIGDILELLSDKYQPFSFRLDHIGYFKSGRQPRVLFLAIDNDTFLKSIVADIEEQLEVLGFEKESRQFKPHLTIGRIKFMKSKEAFYSAIKEMDENDIQNVDVSEIIFYQSVLSSDGPEYKPLRIVKLN